MKKLLLMFGILLSFSINSFSYFDDAFLFVLNPDPYSQAAGASILSLSPSIFGFYTNPASNYKNISKEVQVSYSSIYNNIYGVNAGFILPTEKSGNFSFVVSRFDYNKDPAVVDYNNTTMVAINYVYPLIEQYPIFTEKGSIGITLKYYNLQMKDDASVNLFDIDLGCIYSLDFIDRNLMGAVTVKNIGNDIDFDWKTKDEYGNIETYHWNQKQPTTLTASARYLISELYNVSLMADMVKNFQITDMGYACGLEAVPVNPLTIKIGLRDYRDGFNKGITAGFSLDFDRVNLAYSFSDILGTDDDQHVVSLGFYFGKIPNEAKAYDHYLGYYMNEAKQEYSKRNFISARKQFEDILAVYPDEPVAKKYVQLLTEDLDQVERQSSQKIDKYLARADVALLRNNLLKAKNYYSKVLLIDNKNKQAREGLAKLEAELSEQQIQRNRQKHAKEISKYWVEAMKHFDKGEFVYAKEDFLKITAIDPQNAGALQYLEFIDKKVQKVNRVQANNIFEEGMKKYNEEDYEEALKYFNAAYLSDKTRTDIQEYIKKAKDQINAVKEQERQEDIAASNAADAAVEMAAKEEELTTNTKIDKEMTKIYNTGIEQYNAKNYRGAIKTFNKLRDLSEQYKYFNYSEATKEYLKKSKAAIAKQLYNEGKDLELREEFIKAYNKYQSVLKYDPYNNDAKKDIATLKSVIAQQYYDQGIQKFASGDKKEAMSLLEKSLQYDPKKAEAKKALNQIKKSIEEQ